jgi:hypothetical protein
MRLLLQVYRRVPGLLVLIKAFFTHTKIQEITPQVDKRVPGLLILIQAFFTR